MRKRVVALTGGLAAAVAVMSLHASFLRRLRVRSAGRLPARPGRSRFASTTRPNTSRVRPSSGQPSSRAVESKRSKVKS